MDLKKMHPMARKLNVHTEGLTKALDENNSSDAIEHLNELKKYADYLTDDIYTAVTKADNLQGPNDIFAGGTPLRKFTDAKVSPAGIVSNNSLPGFVSSTRFNGNFRPAQSTFGRKVE